MKMSHDKFGNIILSDRFYSNCLFEAIKAKRWRSDVVIERHYVRGTIVPHFTWRYPESEMVYSFGTDHKIKCPLWFEGYVRARYDQRKKEKRKNDVTCK